jgi:hypothetical protein
MTKSMWAPVCQTSHFKIMCINMELVPPAGGWAIRTDLQSAFQFIPKVFDGVEVRNLCRPVKFFQIWWSQWMGISALTANIHLKIIRWGILSLQSVSSWLLATESILSLTVLSDVRFYASASQHIVFTISIAAGNIKVSALACGLTAYGASPFTVGMTQSAAVTCSFFPFSQGALLISITIRLTTLQWFRETKMIL